MHSFCTDIRKVIPVQPEWQFKVDWGAAMLSAPCLSFITNNVVKSCSFTNCNEKLEIRSQHLKKSSIQLKKVKDSLILLMIAGDHLAESCRSSGSPQFVLKAVLSLSPNPIKMTCFSLFVPLLRWKESSRSCCWRQKCPPFLWQRAALPPPSLSSSSPLKKKWGGTSSRRAVPLQHLSHTAERGSLHGSHRQPFPPFLTAGLQQKARVRFHAFSNPHLHSFTPMFGWKNMRFCWGGGCLGCLKKGVWNGPGMAEKDWFGAAWGSRWWFPQLLPRWEPEERLRTATWPPEW